jgi:hypothetical protein
MTTRITTGKKPTIKNPALRTWVALNTALRNATEQQCEKLLQEELSGRQRKQFLTRIHARLNRVRATRERKELRNKIQ